MPARRRRLLHALGVVALVATSTTVAVGAAPARAAAACTAPAVRIVVDFRHWTPTSANASAGNIVTGCVAWSSTMTGYSLLRGAGFTTDGTRHDGPGFVCRINSLPSEQEDACVSTPPATAYWSYWHADPGDTSWTYSTMGAMNINPKPGSVDLWQFGTTNVQGTQGLPTLDPRDFLPTPAPSAPPAAATPPAAGPGAGNAAGPGNSGSSSSGGTSAGRDTSGGTAGRTPGGALASGTATGPTAGATKPGAAKPGPAKPEASGSTQAGGPGGAGVAATASPTTLDIDSIAKPAGSSAGGTPWATVATVGVLAVAALVGGGVAWRRKRSSP